MENQPYHSNSFTAGVARDTEVEKTFNKDEGFYIDAHNFEPTSNDGKTGALNKIKGEVLLYNNTVNSVGYKCTGSASVGEYLVECWAPTNPAFPGIIRINGVIVLSSVDFELRQDYPVQIDKNRSGNFSEVVINDRKVPPFIFNLKDMVDSLSASPSKYFSAFDPLLYQINLQSALDTLVFDELINVGGGGGLAAGKYQYQLRYASKEGDVTRWSHPTPMIPVVQSLSSESEQYPWVKTFGGPPNPSALTSFAPKLRFRVTNLYNYDFIEIKRISYNSGAGIEYTSNGIVVARVNVGPGEISVREYVDPAESNMNEPLSAEDESREVAFIEKCNSARYFDRRLVLGGVTTASKEANLTFVEVNGKQGFPVVDKLHKAGYNDPWNVVYRQSFMRGEREGFGVNLYDGVGNKGFVSKASQLKDFQFPNRREEVTTDSANFSFGGTVKAANVSANAVSQTFEVFDLNNPITKNNHCDFKNIIEKGRVFGLTGTKKNIVAGGVKWDCDETNPEIENHGADVTGPDVSVSYQPFTPVRATDPNVDGHGYVVNTKIAKGNTNVGPITVETEDCFKYRPPGFGPDYYALGLMFGGVDNFPSWAKSFSVVRTDSARRVLCQGVGFYNLTKGKFKLIGNQSLGGKEKNKFWFFAPDIESGIISRDTVNDIIDNPQNYKLQMVSPLGFFSEWYSGENNFIAGQRDRCIDMIAYARLLRDHDSDRNQQCNPTESPTMGISGGDGFNYITHDKWRNSSINTFFTSTAEAGNRLVNIRAIKRKAIGRGQYLELETEEDIYNTSSTGGNSQSNFEDSGLQNLHEPVYIINIIRTGATVRDNDVQKYKQTTHYQKIESIIGKSNGVFGQQFELVDERWEDCISAPFSTDFNASVARFLYVKLEDGTVEKWQNATYLSNVQKTTLTNNIVNGATQVKGLYTHTNVDNLSRKFVINFNVGTFTPAENSFIIVKYDNTAPIRVYGGDTYIGETIFSPIDGQANAKDKAAETQFALGIGLPFKDFKINPRYYTIRKAGASFNAVQDKEWFTLGFLRQLCVMATVETRAAIQFAHNIEGEGSSTQYFPLKNYVIRPNRWDIDKGTVDNHIYEDYDDDYPGEKNIWKWGGFRFLQQINPDFSCEPPRAFFSKPEFGFQEIRIFPSRIMHSLPRAINVQNSPGLKTFPANNAYDLDDDQGEVKYLWDATTSNGGENLYAFMNTGIAMLLTKKSILSDMTGGDLAYMTADGFVKHHIWMNKEIGMFDQFWRGAAEAVVPITTEGGAEILREALFFPSKESVYRFMDNQLMDIGRSNYHSKLYKEGLLFVLPGLQTQVTGVFDRYKKQYYLHLNGEDVLKTFVFSQKNGTWFGTNDFTFDRFTSSHNQIYGHRDMKTYRLNEGYIINGAPIVSRVLTASAPEGFWDKEFIRLRLNSSSRPTVVNFYKQVDGAIQCSLTSAQLRDYRGYEQFISRILSSVDANRPRFQGRYIIVEIVHDAEEEFRIIDSGIQYKRIKM